MTIGAFPDGMTYVEGRVAAILNGPDDHRLLGVQHLEQAAEAAADLAGADEPGAAAIGRMDLTSELLFSDDPREGRELLTAAQHVDLPWLKAGVEGLKRGTPESVTWRSVNGRSVHLRMYDKGVETGQAPAGMWIRLERQRRARKERERTIAQAREVGLRESFVGRELAALEADGAATTVCDRWGAIEQLRELVERGRLGHRSAELLAGHLAIGGVYSHERTARRREARLRELGIALDPIAEKRRTVDVAAYLRRFVDRFDDALAA